MQNHFLYYLAFSFLLFISCNENSATDKSAEAESEWVDLFNGQDLTGWTPKLAGHELGNNFNNTFRVNEGVLEVNYDEYDTFRNEFGHLFYEKPFSSYHLSLEYRFKGDQSANGPAWAFRNSGVMFHCQDPKTMTVAQSFPICVEYQFLGGNGTDERSTGNLCTPNSHVTMDGTFRTEHCMTSTSPTFHGDDWITAELVVYRDSIAHHIIQGDTVMTYGNFIIDADGMDESAPFVDGQPITGGYIAVQAESHPLEFRNIKIKELE